MRRTRRSIISSKSPVNLERTASRTAGGSFVSSSDGGNSSSGAAAGFTTAVAVVAVVAAAGLSLPPQAAMPPARTMSMLMAQVWRIDDSRKNLGARFVTDGALSVPDRDRQKLAERACNAVEASGAVGVRLRPDGGTYEMSDGGSRWRTRRPR